MSSNPFAEVVDTFFNGRPAPKEARVIRVAMTPRLLKDLNEGKTLQFGAESTLILVTLKK